MTAETAPVLSAPAVEMARAASQIVACMTQVRIGDVWSDDRVGAPDQRLAVEHV